MKKKGFTLIELVVVIAIIGILGAMTTPQVVQFTSKARDARRLADMKMITLAMECFHEDNARYPDSSHDGVSTNYEFIGDNMGPIEIALSPYIKGGAPKDPKFDGSTTGYAYIIDSSHCVDWPLGSCNGNCAKAGVVLGFSNAETASIELHKDTCSGGDGNLHIADYNLAFLESF